MKKNLKFKISFLVSLSVILIAIVTSMVYAFISTTSTRGEIEVSAATITAETTYTATGSSFDWIYTEAGDTKEINITTSNQTGVILHRFYNIELNTESTSDANLLKSIIVYYNDNYIGTLNDIVDSNPDIEEEYNFIGISSNKTDNFKFELHQAAINSIFNAKNVKITITTYTENADYFNYIFVNNESEFAKAIDDVNSGLFENIPSIVLCSNITLENSYTISNPVTIHLNGSTLNGALTINDTVSTNPDALLEVLGTGTFNVTVTLGSNYDSNGAITLVKNHIKEAVASGLAAGSTTNVLGYYSFYGITVEAVTRCTYTAPNVVIADTSNEYYNALGSVRVNNDENISFKILGTKTALLDETLAYMPEDGATITSDLFLPTYIPSQNANITWTSSDESIITSTGMITADRLENAEATLYAEIKVNETIITRTYKFKVSAHNNEINFYKLVQEISPIVINNVRNSAADDDDALYHLPIINVNSNGTFGAYDYRTSYKSPVITQLFDWQAFKDIGLENIEYSVIMEGNSPKYEYITLENDNELYLNTVTLQNYAKIRVTGDFGNSETYTTDINISISVGSNTQLLEKAFTQVSDELADISVLGNILKTRIANGMKNEKGDFSLSHAYTDPETNTVNEEYTIEYSGEADIISSITYNSTTDKYEFAINPEYFNEYETTVAFTATVYYRKDQSGETSKSRTFYVTVPAALHVSDFGTISIYNSTKYQVFNQLPSNEKTHTTGYTVSSSTLTDSNLDYILLRDIVGDANYLAQYNNNNTKYLDMNNITSSNYAKGTETLSYQTAESNPTSTTDTQAYDFARLIEWATGNTRATAASVVSNTSALMSGNTNLGNTKANAEDYLNNDEIAVLKQYYISCTGATNAQWDSLFSEVFNVAPGYIYTNPALLNQIIKALNSNGISFKSSTTAYSSLFGKYMEILQRYAVSTTKVNTNDVAPCQEQYNSTYLWYHSSVANLGSFEAVASDENTYTSTVNYTCTLKDGSYWYRGSRPSGSPSSSGSDGGLGGFYATPAYASDRTSYITEAEYQVVMMFWLNVCADNLNTTINSTNSTAISNVLSANSDYYSKYDINDFNTVGKALINGFDACMEIPTYFATDGVAKIVKSFYDKKNYDLPTYDGTTNTTPFLSSLSGSIPYITNSDNIKSVLSYFTNLKTLTFNGNENLAAFLSENGLSIVFARTGLYNSKIENLTMKHVAHSSVNFDLSNIKNFTSLKELDLSNNTGIQSVNELVNVNRSNYTLVNIEQIGVEYEYQEFAIDNIATPTCTVRYTNAVGTNTYTNDNSRASDLAELSDFNKFITKYMYMTNVVYDDTENGTGTAITWRIDEGNEIGTSSIKTPIASAGAYPTVDSVSAMNQLISPYYYCNEGFTYEYGNQSMTFTAGHLYKINYSDSTLSFVDKGAYTLASSITEDMSNNDLIDTSGHTPRTNVETSQTEEIGSTSTYQTVTWYTENPSVTNVTITFRAFYLYTNYNYILWSTTYYVGANNNQLNSSEGTTYRKAFIFLTENEVLSFQNKSYTSSTTLGATFSSANGNYYMCYLENDSLIFVGTTNSPQGWENVDLTSDYQSSYMVTVNSKKITVGSCYIYLNYGNITYNTSSSTSFTSTSNNVTSTYTITFNPYIEVEYSDDSKQIINAYEAGYDVIKMSNVIITISQLESTIIDYKYGTYVYYYYTGDEIIYRGNTIKKNSIIAVANSIVYPVATRNRTMTIEGTFYSINVWYRETDISEKTYLTMNNVVSVTTHQKNTTATYNIIDLSKPNNESVTSNWSEQWSTSLTSSWVNDGVVAHNYISYVTDIANNALSTDTLDKKVTIYNNVNVGYNYIYKYTGETGSELVYKESTTGTSTSYTNSSGYKLSISGSVLAWNTYNGTMDDETGTTMDSILATANQHFYDYHYGEYYGRYYGFGTYSTTSNNVTTTYTATARYISSGIYVRPGYVYRIMPNATNTAFEWVEVCQYTKTTPSDMLLKLGTGVLNEGDIVYAEGSNAFSSFFSKGWYKVVVDEKTNIVNLVKFNDLGFATNGEKTLTRLTNDKYANRSGDYLGYSGTFTVQISAMIRVITDGVVTKEYIKTYKLKFVGSLTS